MADQVYTAHFLIEMGGSFPNRDVNRYRFVDSADVIHYAQPDGNYTRRNTKVGSGTLLEYFAKNTVSDISGYRKMTDDSGSGTGTDYTGVVTIDSAESGTATIEEWSTDAGILDQIEIMKETFTVTFRSYWTSGGSPDPEHAYVQCDLYRRDSGGSEVLFKTFTQNITATSTKYTATFTDTDLWFAANERLVAKWSCYFDRIIDA